MKPITTHLAATPRSPFGKFIAVLATTVPTDWAKYVHFTCAEGYSSSIDMATALHPQTQLIFKYDGDVLPPKYGFPVRVRIPTKLGFKNPKHVIGLVVLNNYTGGYWEDEGYNWFSGL